MYTYDYAYIVLTVYHALFYFTKDNSILQLMK